MLSGPRGGDVFSPQARVLLRLNAYLGNICSLCACYIFLVHKIRTWKLRGFVLACLFFWCMVFRTWRRRGFAASLLIFLVHVICTWRRMGFAASLPVNFSGARNSCVEAKGFRC